MHRIETRHSLCVEADQMKMMRRGVAKIVRFRKRTVAQSAVCTIVMMCLQEKKEIVSEETTINVFFTNDCHCTVSVALTIVYGIPIISLCTELQQKIIHEVETMTPFIVERVHLFVQRLVMSTTEDGKQNA
ncbi:Asp23 family, cell envelope-related function [Parageobacillus thermantarcticus]|uniref:Asp23 family, cell envelope-related function n=1 Tax=Parageobacillus thermantarcticus TaxID=186116 RepID=A0A1I0T4H8_9BACL|nr:Asp23/Gls24 family envelope stress response protein [Parageobacillus thermantarcticus]SFA46597.1 Asp23 family, cell envelope-related function [Parageobacillus thermantarcticus]